jgi:hypothetical protein
MSMTSAEPDGPSEIAIPLAVIQGTQRRVTPRVHYGYCEPVGLVAIQFRTAVSAEQSRARSANFH